MTNVAEQLTDNLYRELKACANRMLACQRGNITLQSTEIVNEACIRVIESSAQYQDRTHLYRFAAKAMRHLLIDHARAKSAKKRDKGLVMTVQMNQLLANINEPLGILIIDKTLNEMLNISERLVDIVELHYFACFSQSEIAKQLSLSLRTVERELKFARAFMTDKLQQNCA